MSGSTDVVVGTWWVEAAYVAKSARIEARVSRSPRRLTSRKIIVL